MPKENLSPKQRELLARTDLLPVQMAFMRAYSASRLHSELARIAYEIFGEQGPLISGVMQDHFPEPVKYELRSLAQDVTKYLDIGVAIKPKFVRISTINQLRRAVIERDGRGRYG